MSEPALRPTKRWRRKIAVAILTTCIVSGLIPVGESAYEFDAVNLRTRHCRRSRGWLIPVVLFSDCTAATNHPTAVELRRLGMLPSVSASESRWVLIKSFGWRGVEKGVGREFLHALGSCTSMTPVPLPADEVDSENVWVNWARHDPESATEFWSRLSASETGDGRRAGILRETARFIRWSGSSFAFDDLQSYLKEHFGD